MFENLQPRLATVSPYGAFITVKECRKLGFHSPVVVITISVRGERKKHKYLNVPIVIVFVFERQAGGTMGAFATSVELLRPRTSGVVVPCGELQPIAAIATYSGRSVSRVCANNPWSGRPVSTNLQKES